MDVTLIKKESRRILWTDSILYVQYVLHNSAALMSWKNTLTQIILFHVKNVRMYFVFYVGSKEKGCVLSQNKCCYIDSWVKIVKIILQFVFIINEILQDNMIC